MEAGRFDPVLELLGAVDLDHGDPQAVGSLQPLVAVDEDLLEVERPTGAFGLDDRASVVAQVAASPRKHPNAGHLRPW